MRQLDAKYGNLISMVRGLSEKHQAFLPQNGEPASSSSAGRVEKWAEDVNHIPGQEMHPAIKEEDEEGEYKEERKGHFDRPLREIRVGESPSRPWGIPVPPPLDPVPASPPHSPAAPVPLSINAQSNKPSDNNDAVDNASLAPLREATPNESDGAAPPPRRCPFGHGAPQPDRIEPETATIRNEGKDQAADTAEKDPGGTTEGLPPPSNPQPAPPATIIFNGPVFFGYSPEQTALFMQQLGNLSRKDG